MAEEKAEETKQSLVDGTVINQIVTAYLYGIYTYRGGRLTPPESMEKVMEMTRFMDRMGRLSKSLKAAFPGKKET
jgi:hypothetical protein